MAAAGYAEPDAPVSLKAEKGDHEPGAGEGKPCVSRQRECRRSGNNGFIESKYNLACILLEEETELEYAVMLLKEATESGHCSAAINLYLCAVNGYGMNRDTEYAEKIIDLLPEDKKSVFRERIEQLT